MKDKPGTVNKILLLTAALAIGVQYLLAVLGVSDVRFYIITAQALILGIPVLFAVLTHMPVKETIRLKPVKLVNFLIIPFIVAFSIPVVAMLNMLSMLFVENAIAETSTALYEWGLPATLLIMAVAPAVGEEFLFRGIVYNSYRKVSPAGAVFLSALVFGLFHMNFNQMPYAVFLGILMVLVLEATGSVGSTVFLHFLFNGYSCVVGYKSYISGSLAAESSAEAMELLSAPGYQMMLFAAFCFLSVLCLLVIWGLLALLYRANHRKFSECFGIKEYAGNKGKIWDIWLILFVILTGGMSVFSALAG